MAIRHISLHCTPMFAAVEQQMQLESVAAIQRQRVLLIDDDQNMAEVLGTCLSRQGFETIWAPTGTSGLALAHEMRPQVILLDLRLPDMDGLIVCRRLSDSPDTCGIPVIVLSARHDADIVRQCREAGCVYYLCKPYDPNTLLVLIQRAIQQRNEWDLAFI